MNIDLAMTILDIAGVNISALDMDGQSFLPQLVSGDIFATIFSCTRFLGHLHIFLDFLRCPRFLVRKNNQAWKW